jgi:hypothetical protein
MSAELTARKVAQVAAIAAKVSVALESDAAILGPRYTTSALQQMGWARSYGRDRAYRAAFADYFTLAWLARYTTLSGAAASEACHAICEPALDNPITITFKSRISGISHIAYVARTERVITYTVDGTHLVCTYADGRSRRFEAKFGSVKETT